MHIVEGAGSGGGAKVFLSVEIGFREADPGMSGPRRGPACVENKFFEKI